MTAAPSRPWTTVLQRAALWVLYVLGMTAILVVTLLALKIPPIPALQAIVAGAIGDSDSGTLAPLANTLTKTAPLLLTGLSVVVAWRSGMFSIGAEGQLLMGALAAVAVWAGLRTWPPFVLVVMMLIAGGCAGAVWSGIAAWLRNRRNVPEVISTIMLNYIALNIIGALVSDTGALHGKTQAGPYSDPLPDAIALPNMLARSANGVQVHMHLGIAIAFAAAPVVALYLYRTAAGFGISVVGQNPDAARVARLPIARLRMQAMLVSGALSGLAGGIELLGVTGRLGTDFSAGWGYTAIPVALLGGLSPCGAMISALFFGALAAGCNNAQRVADVPSVVAYIIQAATVLTVLAGQAWRKRSLTTESN